MAKDALTEVHLLMNEVAKHHLESSRLNFSELEKNMNQCSCTSDVLPVHESIMFLEHV